MTTLREKIEGLARYDLVGDIGGPRIGHDDNGQYYDRDEVLRIVAEHEHQATDDGDKLLKIAGLFNGWANAGPPKGGPENIWTAKKTLHAIGAVLGDPFKQKQRPIPDMTPGGVHRDLKPENITKGGGANRPAAVESEQRDRPNVTPPPVGQAGGEEFRLGLPPLALRKAWPYWTELERKSNAEADLEFKGEFYRFAWWAKVMPDRRIDSFGLWHEALLRPHGRTWAEVEQMAQPLGASEELRGEGQAWRRELGRLRNLRGACVTEEDWKKREQVWRGCNARLDALEELFALARVIESGKGAAEVPEGVAALMDAPAGVYRKNDMPHQWQINAPGRLVSVGSGILMDAINRYGDSLIEVAR